MQHVHAVHGLKIHPHLYRLFVYPFKDVTTSIEWKNKFKNEMYIIFTTYGST